MLPLTCTVYCDAPMTVARMRTSAGRSGILPPPNWLALGAHFFAEMGAEIAQIALFIAVNELGNAAGEHHRVDRIAEFEIGREQEILHLRRKLAALQDFEQRIAELL